jgi:hypothetical protein
MVGEAMARPTAQVDALDLERRVKGVYRDVAQHPQDMYHFEMGRALAERLGYPPALLDRVPEAAVESFAGVGYYLKDPGLSRMLRCGEPYGGLGWARRPGGSDRPSI